MPVDRLLDAEVIGRELERILASPVFKSSKRTSLLLRYIVERTLEGQTELLKERLLGIEVFGRAFGYDTGSDHVVRSTAGEIRKRLAQYYLQPECDSETRIELLPGSYIPQFRVQENKSVDVDPPVEQEAPAHATALSQRSRPRRRIELGVAIIVGLAAAGWGVGHFVYGRNAVHRFWSPLLESRVPIVICVGDPRTSWDGSEASAFRQFPLTGPDQPEPPVAPRKFWFQQTSPFGDAVTAARLFALVGETAGDHRIVYGPDSSLSDLRQNPAVLIGGIDNFWTMSLTRDLRYRFQLDSQARTIFIEDGRAPSRRDWQVALDLPRSAVTVDYALVARFVHPATGHPVVIAGGIRDCGTLAAGEFLTSAAYLGELERRAPARWNNVEAVLSTKVFRGLPGPPQLVAAHYW